MSSVPMSLLTGAARQPLFSVILPRSIYLCLFAKFSPLQTVGQPPDAWRSVSTVFRYTACVRIFPAHCAGVTNKSPHYNLSSVVKIHWRHRRMRSRSASQKDYQLVFIFLLLEQEYMRVLQG